MIRRTKKNVVVTSDVEEDNVTTTDDENEVEDEDEADLNGEEPQTNKMEEGDEFIGWEDGDMSSKEAKLKAKKILLNCREVSSSLRRALKLWEGRPPSGAEPLPLKDKSCVDLTTLDFAASGSQMLLQQDVENLCNGLELKPYQLVGVNWLRLLHENDVNGVVRTNMNFMQTKKSKS